MAEKLAIEGGDKVIGRPLPGWPQFSEKTIREALAPLKNGKVNYWTGPRGFEFEEKWAAYNGLKFAISITSGTSALHTALAGLGIGPGDEVIVPSYTFIATSFSVVQAGAIPVFADVEIDTHCISVDSIREKITDRTRAIVPVHLYGNMADMDPVMELAKEHNLLVIEDAAQAHGATYKGKKVGSIGDVGCFSFCQSKTFTTGGEGGAVITNDEEVAWNCRSFRDHGYDVKERLRLLELEGRLPYIHNMVGYNYRMTEIQSIIGICELERLDTYHLPRRRRNGEILIEELTEEPWVKYLPIHNERGIVNGFFVFPITLDLDGLTCKNAEEFADAVKAEGAPAGPVFWPQCYMERAFTEHNGFGRFKFPFRSKEYTNPESVKYTEVNCPNAAWHQDRTFITIVHPALEEEHMRLMAKAIKKVAAAYSK